MAYDYNSQDSRLDFPNPYKIENIFYFCAAATLVVGGLVLLFVARGSLGSGLFLAMSPLIIGIAMLVHGLFFASKGMARLRFYFGRDQPSSMAPNLSSDQVETTYEADNLKELLRHSSLVYQEPTGPLSGVLYSILPNLIFAPRYIQVIAQRQFQNGLSFLITLLTLMVSLYGASKSASGWLGLFYFVIALFILLKPIENSATSESELGFKGFIGLILLSIFGPVLIPMILKGAVAPSWLPGMGQAAFVMVASLIAIALFFLAVLSQTLKSPPQANMAVVQDTLTMNSHPKQLLDELERKMQEQWVATLPNRCYSRLFPVILPKAQSGSFEGELLEETQPVPKNDLKSMTFSSCFSEPYFRWLGWLNSYGLIMMLISVITMVIFATTILTAEGLNRSIIPFATLGISLWVLGNYCFGAGKFLWGRFDFISKLIWVEIKGNYQSAQMDYGNKFTDRVQSKKQVINIETMTLRVWIAEVETVTYGKNSIRSILAMRGLKDEAAALHLHLTTFGQQQSMFVAPTSSVDLQRASSLGAMNQIGGKGIDGLHALSGSVADALKKATVDDQSVESHMEHQPPVDAHDDSNNSPSCPQCQTPTQPGMKFCPDCGTRLALV